MISNRFSPLHIEQAWPHGKRPIVGLLTYGSGGPVWAAYALSTEVRPRIIQRTRDYVRRDYINLNAWVESHSDLFSVIPPEAAAIAFVKYEPAINSNEFVQYLAKNYDTYIAPGDHFGVDGYIRISYGLPDDYVKEGLRRIYQAFTTFPRKKWS